MAAALAAMLAALWQRRIVPALLLATSLYLCLHSIRLQASFACVTAVVGGSILADALPGSWLARLWRDRPDGGFRSTIVVAAAALLIAFATVRIGDLVSDRYFLQTPDQYSLFGSGAPSWYPEQAVSFLAGQRLPGNLFTEYNLGGFAAWRLSPASPVYIDGRAVPFGSQLFFRSLELLQQPLDSPEWQSEASARDIHTVLVSLDFVLGGGLPRIDAFCRSQQWSPVYLDTRAAIFVRAAPGDNRFDGLRIDCNQVRFDAPPDGAGVRGNADRFHYYLNSAAILLVLGRSPEAQRQLELAQRIFSASSSLHYLKGLALVYNGFPSDAEREFRTSLRLDPADRTFQALALLYRQQGRYVEAAALLDRAVKNSIQPYQLLLTQGYVQLEMGAPAQALLSFDQAATGSPFVGEALPLGTEFNSQLAEGRENAWSKLADFYDARGLQTEALHARQQADSIARSREKSAPPQPPGD
jgi:tetratricopeptide (TPR) repeat protein